MINKTFNSDSTDGRALEVGRNGERPWLNIQEFDLENTMFMLAQSDAPALALAILEAAGYTEDTENFGTAVHELGLAIKEQERATAEAKEQAELEAEALELANSAVLVVGNPPYPSIEHMSDTSLRKWLAVARKAREMRKS